MTEGKGIFVFQVRDFDGDGDGYDLSMYFVEDDRSGQVHTSVRRSRDTAIGTNRIMELMGHAGLVDVVRTEDACFRPVLTGTKPA